MVVDALDKLASAFASASERMRGAIRPAESMVESRINSTISSLADALGEVAAGARRMRCVAEAVKASGSVARLCGNWRVAAEGERVYVARVNPQHVVSLGPGGLLLQEAEWKLLVSGTTVRLCRWNYCKGFSVLDRSAMAEELPQIIYLMRGAINAARRFLEAATLCARREAPACARA